MSISPSGAFAAFWFWSIFAIFILFFLISIYKAPWQKLLQQTYYQHIFLASSVFLILFWSLKTEVSSGINIHFLGVTTLTLMFGWPFAILNISIVLIVLSIIGIESFKTFPFNIVFSGIIPIFISYFIYYFSQRFLPYHFAIYVFFCAFLGAAVATLIAFLTTIIFLTTTHAFNAEYLYYAYLPYTPLILFTEAFLNGMLITVLVVLKPEWLTTFDDEKYILNK